MNPTRDDANDVPVPAINPQDSTDVGMQLDPPLEVPNPLIRLMLALWLEDLRMMETLQTETSVDTLALQVEAYGDEADVLTAPVPGKPVTPIVTKIRQAIRGTYAHSPVA
jgi:hypothetical protein